MTNATQQTTEKHTIIQKGDRASIEYTGTFQDGSVFDSSSGRAPLQFEVGAGQVIPGFEKAVERMKVDEEKTFTIAAEEAYGPIRAELVQEVPKDKPLETALLEPSPISSVPVVEAKPEPQPLPLTGFTIQVALFEKQEEAQAEKERIQSLGFPSVLLREAAVQDRVWYFVDLGFFKDKEKAQSYATLLQKKKVISAYFIRGAHLNEDQKN